MKIPLNALHTVGAALRDVRDGHRYRLATIYFERNNERGSATCTDGKQLIHTTWKDANPEAVNTLVSADSVRKTLKIKDGSHHEVKLAASEMQLLPGLDKVSVDTIDATYPDYKNLLDKSDNETEILVNPHLLISTLQTICKVLSIRKRDHAPVRLSISEPGHPIRIEGQKGGVSSTGLVMPSIKQ